MDDFKHINTRPSHSFIKMERDFDEWSDGRVIHHTPGPRKWTFVLDERDLYIDKKTYDEAMVLIQRLVELLR